MSALDVLSSDAIQGDLDALLLGPVDWDNTNYRYFALLRAGVVRRMDGNPVQAVLTPYGRATVEAVDTLRASLAARAIRVPKDQPPQFAFYGRTCSLLSPTRLRVLMAVAAGDATVEDVLRRYKNSTSPLTIGDVNGSLNTLVDYGWVDRVKVDKHPIFELHRRPGVGDAATASLALLRHIAHQELLLHPNSPEPLAQLGSRLNDIQAEWRAGRKDGAVAILDGLLTTPATAALPSERIAPPPLDRMMREWLGERLSQPAAQETLAFMMARPTTAFNGAALRGQTGYRDARKQAGSLAALGLVHEVGAPPGDEVSLAAEFKAIRTVWALLDPLARLMHERLTVGISRHDIVRWLNGQMISGTLRLFLDDHTLQARIQVGGEPRVPMSELLDKLGLKAPPDDFSRAVEAGLLSRDPAPPGPGGPLVTIRRKHDPVYLALAQAGTEAAELLVNTLDGKRVPDGDLDRMLAALTQPGTSAIVDALIRLPADPNTADIARTMVASGPFAGVPVASATQELEALLRDLADERIVVAVPNVGETGARWRLSAPARSIWSTLGIAPDPAAWTDAVQRLRSEVASDLQPTSSVRILLALPGDPPGLTVDDLAARLPDIPRGTLAAEVSRLSLFLETSHDEFGQFVAARHHVATGVRSALAGLIAAATEGATPDLGRLDHRGQRDGELARITGLLGDASGHRWSAAMTWLGGTAKHAFVLSELAESTRADGGHAAGLSAGALSARMPDTTQSVLYGLLDHLAELGLAQQLPGPPHAYSLTPKGLAFHDQLEVLYRVVEPLAARRMSPEWRADAMNASLASLDTVRYLVDAGTEKTTGQIAEALDGGSNIRIPRILRELSRHGLVTQRWADGERAWQIAANLRDPLKELLQLDPLGYHRTGMTSTPPSGTDGHGLVG